MTRSETQVDLAERLTNDAAELGQAVTPAQAEMLIDYLNLLVKWNAVYNLTAIREIEQMRIQHLLDSMSLIGTLDRYGVQSVIDVGTGGGLPGIVIAIMRPQWRLMLNDIVHKKTAFLMQVKGSLHLQNVAIHTGRVEHLKGGDQYDAVVCRAFADLVDIVHWTRHLTSPTGAIFAMKGQRPDEEIGRLPNDVEVIETSALLVPGLDAARHLVVIRV